MSKLKILIIGVLLCSFSTAAFTHHSRSHYSREYTEVVGEIVEVHWKNPHVYYTIKTTDAEGRERLVLSESGGPRYLERTGFMEDSLQVGDQVTFGGQMSRFKDTEMLISNITMPDGEFMPFSRDDFEANFKDQQIDTAAENKGIFRVWSIPPNNERQIHTSLNELGRAKQAEFDTLDNFSTRCEASGMPRLMWFPHPFEFVDLGNVLQVNIEIYNQVRTIHMDHTETPEDFPGSPLGYSVGHWEDKNTLVVKTTDMNWGYYSTSGEPMSDEAVVIERFELSEDQSRLDLHIETTDPVYFNDPAVVAAYWVAVGDSIKYYDCINVSL